MHLLVPSTKRSFKMVLKEKNCCDIHAQSGSISKITNLLLFLLNTVCILCNALLRFVFRRTEKSVKGEIVLVTGAGSGLGRQLALQYANLDATVVCLDINPEPNTETVAEIKKSNKNAFGYVCDVGNESQVKNTIAKILEEVGDIGIVVNNAGMVQTQSFLKLTSDQIRRIFDVNLMAHFWVLQMVLPTMIKNNHGHIVAISSGLGLVGLHHVTTYCTSKFAIIGLMKSLEDEIRLNPTNNIKFTTVMPGFMDTEFCTNFCARRSYFSDPVSVVEVARVIISAQRRDIAEVSVPKYLLPLCHVASLLPKEIIHTALDSADITFHL